MPDKQQGPGIGLISFLARYAIYGVVPGMWFAYLGGVAPWLGGAGGFLATLVMAIPVRAAAKRKHRDAWMDPNDN